MSSIFPQNVLVFKCAAAIVKGVVVKPGADKDHAIVSAAATSLNFGINQTLTTTAEDKMEVAMPGGGAKGLAGGTFYFGDLLTADSAGKLVATTTPGNRYIAMALEDAVAEDLASVFVCAGLI